MAAQSSPATPQYFSFKDFLSEEEAATFFQLSHAQQVAKVTQYLDFLGEQPAAAQFTSSSKASISFAALRSDGTEDEDSTIDAAILQNLLQGRTRSGFGAFGTESGFLPQKELSLAVANTVEEIGHTYIVERNKRGAVKPPVLNSRSFFFYWCHAEKQKLLDIRQKLTELGTSRDDKRKYWHRIVVVVDRSMCADCIRFAECFACCEKISLYIRDPDVLRIFPPSSSQEVQSIMVSADVASMANYPVINSTKGMS
ncbi:hypothetical protein PHYBOEH_005468 [Phytophthora boehmeriae]|uniref:Single-strand DNA deaminase toxin A-like C-terminal domain-containing protein n=1 Tax=Phytophthora boehmeriae TaxID=109152 RepID=A0A8T1WQK5_9STRA|nr:hypothetical protein PHYBOEH_005468 [Phytophthora boehmeriae]